MRAFIVKGKRKNREGFTLVELICVIAILGILVAIAVPSYKGIQDKSAHQVAIANARSNYTLGKAQAEMVASGVMNPSETEDYSYTEDANGVGSATWEGKINGKDYKAVFPGSSGDGEIMTAESGK